MNCPICGNPIKSIPAGVSKKTGKPYKAFQVCSNNECQYKPTEEDGTENRVVTSLNRNPINGEKTDAMLMSYAKDLVIFELDNGVSIQEDSVDRVINYYKRLKNAL